MEDVQMEDVQMEDVQMIIVVNCPLKKYSGDQFFQLNKYSSIKNLHIGIFAHLHIQI
jgi:hypothetical protein